MTRAKTQSTPKSEKLIFLGALAGENFLKSFCQTSQMEESTLHDPLVFFDDSRRVF